MSNFSSSNGACRFLQASATFALKISAAALALGTLGALSQPASAGESARALRTYKASELLVAFRSGAATQGSHNSNLQVGARSVESFPLFRSQKVVLPAGMTVAQAISLYSQDPNVLLAQPNYLYKALAVPPFPWLNETSHNNRTPTPTPVPTRKPNDPLYNDQWGLKKIKAPQVWKTATGSRNIVVGVLDTGIRYTHTDLVANMWHNSQRTVGGAPQGEIPGNGIDDDGNGYIDDYYGINAVTGSSDPMDDEGHGTHVAGIVGATGNNRNGVSGVNWQVQLMALKFLNADGVGTTANLLKCLQYAIDMKTNRGVNLQVINCSFGISGGSGPER